MSEREKDIRYSSRTRRNTDIEVAWRRVSEAARRLAAKVPAELRADPDMQELLARTRITCSGFDIVHLIYRAKQYEHHSKDYEFSRATPCASTGRAAAPTCCRRCADPRWTEREPGHGVRVFDLVRPQHETAKGNRLCLVTGAASGLGKAIAVRFAEEGARVAIADLNKAQAQAVADEIKGLGVAMDVTSEEQVNRGVAGPPSGAASTCWSATPASRSCIRWRSFPSPTGRRCSRSISTAFLTTRACVPHMKRSGRGGSIIYMGSVHSKEASVLKSAYVTAKHGLIGLAKTVAKEGGNHGIRANVICPGFVRTPLVDKQIPEQARTLGISEEDVIKKVMLGQTVDGEFTTVEDIAEVALLFASFPTNALTGQSLVVSHGWFMQKVIGL